MARGPVGHTCPDIDKIISMLEDLRRDNENLRYWGAEQEDRADELKEELAEANKRIVELEDEVAELSKEVARD